MGLAKPLHLRLFLEGVEVPVVSAQVAVSFFAPASAAIQVVPVDEGLYFKPRTMVHLFFLEEPQPVASSEATTGQERAPVTLGDSASSDTSYKLLFTGEVVGFSFVKQPLSRSLVLQCLDFSSYWDTLYSAFLDWSSQGNALTERAYLYGSEPMFSNMPTQNPEQILASWIRRRPSTPGLSQIGGLAGGIIHMMEQMGGTHYYGRPHKLGVNDFYTLAELRCHLLQQVTADENDSTAERLVDMNVFWNWILNEVQTVGNEITLRDMFKLLCRFIYYSIIPNPVAKFDAYQETVKVKTPAKDIKIQDLPDFNNARQAIQKAHQALSETDPVTAESAGVCALNVKQCSALVSKIPGVSNEVKTLVQKSLTLVDALNARIVTMSEKEKREARQELKDALNDASSAFHGNVGVVAKRVGASVFETASPARLRTQIFRPDCYMAAPPLCNVVFPEMYSALNYDRSYAGEVTRVGIMSQSRLIMAATSNSNPTAQMILGHHFVEPRILEESADVIRRFGSQWRMLMPHEMHTGIIVRTEWLPSDFGSARGEDTSAAAHAHISWQRRTGLHHFFKYRIAPRTMNVAGRFNPYLVAGFPALVIQKPFYYEDPNLTDEQLLEKVENTTIAQTDLKAPPQFLGMVEGLQHAITQEGGQTSFSMSHCRTHLGIDDEFVGLVIKRAKDGQKHTHRVKYALRYDAVKDNPARLKFLIDCTPQSPSAGGSVTKKSPKTQKTSYTQKQTVPGTGAVSRDVSTDVKTSVATTEANEPSYVSESPAPWDASLTVMVPNGGQKAIGSTGLYGGKVQFIQVLAPYGVVATDGGGRAFSAIMVYEDLQVSIAGAEIPVEEVIRPVWLARSYDNERVGKEIYQPFFGCGSILDQISFDGTLSPRPDEAGTEVEDDEDPAELIRRVSELEKSRAHYSVERAVNTISYIYGKVKKAGGLDVDEFITALVKRPIATKKDLLGSFDLELEVEGEVPKVLQGEIGFHTLSVHTQTSSAGRLIGLTHDPAATLERMDRNSPGSLSAMASRYDVRWEKLERVMLYREALEKGTGLGYVG